MIFLLFVYYSLTTNSHFLTAALKKGPKATMKRTCAVHESKFKRLLLSDCYVDKSLFIESFLTMEPRIARVTAPRGFGKTVNLKMLKYFLEAKNGLITSTNNCSFFIKRNLNIFKLNNTFFYLHCGKYPIIFINFKKIRGNSFSDIIDTIRDVIRDSFLEHKYLLTSDQLLIEYKKRILLYTSKVCYKNITERILNEGLAYLSEMLHLHFNKTKVIVLIDDFDAPVWKFLSRNFPISDVHKTIYLIRNLMYYLLENNRYIEKCLISDRLSLSSLIIRQTNAIINFPFLRNHRFVNYYGLTEDEVKEKLNYFNILHKHKDVKEYYNGYKVQDLEQKIYSSWSVMNYLQTEDLKDYLIGEASLRNLSDIFVKREVRRLFSELLHGRVVGIESVKETSFNDILILRDIMKENYGCSWVEAEAFLLFLFDNGYLTFMNSFSLKIPNKQIYQHIHKQFFSAFINGCFVSN